MQSKDHWEQVYSTKSISGVSWFQEHAQQSVQLIRQAGLARERRQAGGDGGAQQLQAAIELTGIFPAPTETGDPECQARHGGRGFAQGLTGSCDHV